MSGLRWESAIRREQPVARHIPYRAHVAPNLVRTVDGDYVQVFRLSGASFESADDADLNNWHERLNVTWRNMASPNVAIWTHIIRRREHPSSAGTLGADFASQLAFKYQRRIAGETLMVNEIYLSLVYRSVAGTASSLLAKALSRCNVASRDTLTDALDECEKLGATLLSSFARYEPERLGIYSRGDRQYSRPLEFFALLAIARISGRCSKA
jgi:type IV secretion system protein VirB4